MHFGVPQSSSQPCGRAADHTIHVLFVANDRYGGPNQSDTGGLLLYLAFFG